MLENKVQDKYEWLLIDSKFKSDQRGVLCLGLWSKSWTKQFLLI